jgi:predicted PurR-regulated permease PerM
MQVACRCRYATCMTVRHLMSGAMPDPIKRDWPRVAALAALTTAGVVVCVLLAVPFLPALTWSVALAVVAMPVHRVVARWVSNENSAAGISTLAVVLVIGLPVVVVFGQLATETAKAVESARTEANEWWDQATRLPWVGDSLAKLSAADIEQGVRQLVGQLVGPSLGVAQGVVGGLLQALAAVFLLFFFLRDHRHLRDQARAFLPLSVVAADRVLGRAADAVHATVYGTLVTGVLQGATGGLLFWALGLPAPVLWGVVMTVLGILPFLGAFLVWAPAAVYLASHGQWWQAGVLVGWGVLMAGPVCNWVYAVAAGGRMRMHPVPTLLAFIGGLAVFGVSGMILGPCVLAVTLALIAAWKERTADGTPVAAAASPARPVPEL